jgi:hypothetical protein
LKSWRRWRPPPSETSKLARRRAITDFIRTQKRAGKLIERRVFSELARSSRRVRVYQFVATNLALDLR